MTRSRDQSVEINSSDFWVKVVGMLQQNWALVDPAASGTADVYFVDDGGGVFDQIAFPNADSAFAALARNGFARLIEDTHLQSFLSPPAGPYQERSHPSGRIYSSGRYWRG